MIVFVVLANGYAQIKGRLNFLLQVISHATDTDCLIVTHEFFSKNKELLYEGTSNRFYEELEMKKVSKQQIDALSFCFIPDKYFENIMKNNVVRTKALIEMCNSRNDEIENFVINCIDEELKKRGQQKPEYIMNCIDTIASVRYLGDYYNCHIIPYVFAPIKKIHGYSQTFYLAHLDNRLYTTDLPKKIYSKVDESRFGYKLFSKNELLAILGKKRNMHLLNLLDYRGHYCLGIASQSDKILPQTFYDNPVTDDDIYYESVQLFDKDKITMRLHPNQYDRIGLSRKHMKNDPVEFILSSDIIATVQSQLILKAALWNRKVAVYADILPYTFGFSRSISSAKEVSDKMLNFIIFGYFVPSGLVFDEKYWTWRMQNPDINKVMDYHIKHVMEKLGINMEIVCASENRLISLLQARGMDKNEIEGIIKRKIQQDDISYKTMTSRLVVEYSDGKSETFYCVNTGHECVYSCFDLKITEEQVSVSFFPLDDVDGFVEIKACNINGKQYSIDSNKKYYSKNQKAFSIGVVSSNKKLKMEIVWGGLPFLDI